MSAAMIVEASRPPAASMCGERSRIAFSRIARPSSRLRIFLSARGSISATVIAPPAIAEPSANVSVDMQSSDRCELQRLLLYPRWVQIKYRSLYTGNPLHIAQPQAIDVLKEIAGCKLH